MTDAGKIDSRTALLDAAERLLIERGHGALTVRVVASEAGVNHGLVRAGVVERKLPLPMAKNDYGADRPTWALFLTAVHVGMALCLAAGVVSLYRGLLPS